MIEPAPSRETLPNDHSPNLPTLDIGNYQNRLGLANKLGRVLWGIVWATLFRLSPRPFFGWRRMLLRLFGAKMASTAKVYPTTKIWAPWNLEMADYACMADDVDCYSVDKVILGENVTVSQYAYLCSASHDETDPRMTLIHRPIVIGRDAWICADAFVGMGVTVGDGAVVGARSSAFSDVPAWKICVGTPARPIRDRVIRDLDAGDASAS